MFEFIRKHLDAGYQAYIVCPLVEESELVQGVLSVEEYFKKAHVPFKNYKIDLLHGKMTPKKKDEIMLKFKSGETQLLISTVVIEVGVDVPNAVIMVIENAERFGLSQLHQLRGRVGRGSAKSTCVLVTDATGDEATARMNIMCQTTDGFKISEEDFKLRGSGDLFGIRQSGDMNFKLADLKNDYNMLLKAKEDSDYFIKNDLNKIEYKHIKNELAKSINLD
jgi:ATP-dependent DNA helicase RecG